MIPEFGAHSVPAAKVRDYLLNAANPANRGKAKWFESFGFRRAAWPLLQQALFRHPLDHPVLRSEESEYGRKLVVEGGLVAPDGRLPWLRSVWIVRPDEVTQFVTAFPA
ncbi:hypothetical protein IP88_00810 [alpha proteobacterium AAP81b]|nr:hypothetical protein IP88_00810 [alpha proteobacterium AAP81b]